MGSHARACRTWPCRCAHGTCAPSTWSGAATLPMLAPCRLVASCSGFLTLSSHETPRGREVLSRWHCPLGVVPGQAQNASRPAGLEWCIRDIHIHGSLWLVSAPRSQQELAPVLRPLCPSPCPSPRCGEEFQRAWRRRLAADARTCTAPPRPAPLPAGERRHRIGPSLASARETLRSCLAQGTTTGAA
jgi:hypothetical protein